MKYSVLIRQDKDGMFVAEVPELPGCITQGKTREEAMANAKEAIAVYLESLEAHGKRAEKFKAATESVFEQRKSVFEELAKGRD